MIYPIVQVGSSVLREEADPVTDDDLKSEWFAELVPAMKETMREAPGVGLAAPQIGKSLRLFVIEDDSDFFDEMTEEQLQELDRERVPFYVVVNPTLTPLTDETVDHFEGCLSVDGFRAVVPRFTRVRVDGQNENGEPISIDAHGWHARILQHEFDHLNGILYIDRMDSRTFASNDFDDEDEEDKEITGE